MPPSVCERRIARRLVYHLTRLPQVAYDSELSLPIAVVAGVVGFKALQTTALAKRRGWHNLAPSYLSDRVRQHTRIACGHLMAAVGQLGRSEQIAFVTLVDERFTLGLDTAGTLDIRRLQAWARAELPGCSFVGMVEAALYTNVGLVKAGMKRAVSWHVHLIVWGISEARLAELIASLNARRQTLVPGVTAGHYRMLEPEEVQGQAIYMLKPPISDHRIYQRKRTVSDRETGEVHEEGTGRFKQRKGALKPGNLAHMSHVMGDRTLDKLAFAAGEGAAVLEAINSEALAPYRLSERIRIRR